MAIKTYKEIDSEILHSLCGKRYSVYEKLDMVYFKIKHTDNGAFLYNRKGKEITIVDRICNSMWETIYNDVVKPLGTEENTNLKGCEIGLFYLPVHKTKVIDYQHLPEKSYYFSDFKAYSTYVPTLKHPYENFDSPLIIDTNILYERDLVDLGRVDLSNAEKASMLIGSDTTFSGNDIDNIEGVVVTFNDALSKKPISFQIPIVDTKVDIDKFTKSVYRELILTDFANITLSDSNVVYSALHDNDNYVSAICDLFNHYMNNTDVFFKNAIESEDLLPPHVGYMGDICIDMLNNVNTKLICKYDQVAKNVLRMLLMTFKNSEINNKLEGINDKQKVVLNSFNEKLHKSF